MNNRSVRGDKREIRIVDLHPLSILFAMRIAESGRTLVADDVWLDGRLALFHETQSWLALADLHFGFELSHRAAGNLFPLWGMQSLEARLLELLDDYRPDRLVLVGDLVHDRAGGDALFALIERFQSRCEIVMIAGNHDRHITRIARERGFRLQPSWQIDGFNFDHGDCAADADAPGIRVIGHHHPAGVVRDGAGLRLKLPAFVQQKNCWILPAFSPWAAGAVWPNDEQSRIWLCSPQRILRLEQPEAAA